MRACREYRLGVTLACDCGLHFRVASQVAQEARKAPGLIKVFFLSRRVDARSVLALVSLAASRGSYLELSTRSAESVAAVWKIKAILTNHQKNSPLKENPPCPLF